MTMIRCRQCGIPMEETRPSGLCAQCDQLDELPDALSDRKELFGVPFVDMKRLDEVDRINKIAEYLKNNPGKTLQVMVDCGPGYEDKGDRWIERIIGRVPDAKVVNRYLHRPIRGVESIFLRYEPQ